MIIVTGGGSGIGRSLSHSLASRGETVMIVGRREEALKETSSFHPERITYIVCDVSDPSHRESMCKGFNDTPNIKALVHNAGILEPLKPLADVSLAEWQFSQAVNVEAPLFLTQALLPKLKGGRVLHLSSGAAHDAYSHWGAYCTSKSALYMLYRLFKQEVSDVLFGSVMPGITDTAMQDMIRCSDTLPKEVLRFFRELKSENKLLTTETVAEFLTWLLLDVSDKNYAEKEWDIYDATHHNQWLKKGEVPKVFSDA